MSTRKGRPPSFAANPYILLDAEDEHLLERSWSFLYTPYNVYVADEQRRLLHREVMGAKKGEVVDHLNQDGLDNRKANLKVCTQRENILRAHHEGGVYKKGLQWVVQMGGKYLGGWPTLGEAISARRTKWEKRVG